MDYYNGGALPALPQPSLPLSSLHLQSLPDLAHDIITSYLPPNDLLRLTETGWWQLKCYGNRISQVVLRYPRDWMVTDQFQEARRGAAITSLIGRRLRLSHLSVLDWRAMAWTSLAIRLGFCERLKVLEVGSFDEDLLDCGVGALLQALSTGACCANLQELRLAFRFRVPMMALGDALRSRMSSSGWKGLKVLEVKRSNVLHEPELSSMSPILSSGACDFLEELRLDCWLSPEAHRALSDWLLRTRAPHLRRFMAYISSDLAATLSLPGMAPCLQSLDLRCLQRGWGLADNDRQVILHLAGAIERGAWRDLREIRAAPAPPVVARLMEAIRVGAPQLRVLAMIDPLSLEGGLSVTRALGYGAFPHLQELELQRSNIGDTGLQGDDVGGCVNDIMAELARAFQQSTRSFTHLQRLNLSSCDIYHCSAMPQGMMAITEALSHPGCCPVLHYLNLSYNLMGDDVMSSFAARIRGGGSLSRLGELNLVSVMIGDRGACALAQALEEDACPKLRRLLVSYNNVSTSGTRRILQGLWGRRRVEVDIDVYDKDMVGYEADGVKEEEEEEVGG